MRAIWFFGFRYTFAACVSLGAVAPCMAASSLGFEAQASGVFLNANGDVLTARHAVAGCGSLYVVKDARVVTASLRAVSDETDVAVLATALKPVLSAVFSRTELPSDRSVAVFAEAYSRLLRMPDRARVLSNAMTVVVTSPTEGRDLQLLSGVKPGASGSPVLGVGGLLLGIVVERVAGAPGTAEAVLLQSGNPAKAAGATSVRAVSSSVIKRFLRAHGIDFSESDAAQISMQQSPAARAFTLEVGVICG